MGKTILIVDDSKSIRAVVTYILEEAGYNVLVAEDGKDALNYLDGRQIDLILTDLHMPVMDGMGLIKNVRNLDTYKFVPVLFLTTEEQESIKMQAKLAGATGWIVKPFVPEKLASIVKKVIP